jgi:hypothetical protein
MTPGWSRAELPAGWPGDALVKPPEDWNARQDIGELAASVRRAEHDDASDAIGGEQPLGDGDAQKDAAERMGDEVD